MRICYLANLFPPVQTGTSYYTRQLTDAMVAAGHEVLVITCAEGRIGSDSVEQGVRVIRLPSRGVPRLALFQGFDRFRLAWTPRNYRQVEKAARAFRPDLIHACGHLLDLAHLAGRLARDLGVVSACSIHTVIHHPENKLSDWLLRTVDQSVHARLAMKWFDWILTLDKDTSAYARRTYPGMRTVPVPWGVSFDFDRYHHTATTDGTLKVLSVGHLTHMRSRAALIEAVGRLRDEGIPCALRIVGKICTDDPLKQVEARGLADRVLFIGEQPREQVLKELVACDVHAMWISNPGVGSAGMEAMSVGVPTMMWAAPDQLGFVDLQHMENTVLIDPSDPETVAEALRCLARDTGLRERIGRQGRELARENFSWPRIAIRMGEIYERLVTEARATHP
ncbi:MAG: glycosyltransferase family 4 protein [Vicinamibacteria bacterium]